MAMVFTGAKIIVTFHHTKFLQERCLFQKKKKKMPISVKEAKLFTTELPAL